MSASLPDDPRLPQAGATDESLLNAHEAQFENRPPDGGHYRMLPLILLFVFSGVIFFSATYLNRYTGRYHADIFNETAQPTNGVVVRKVDPVALGKKQFEQVCSTCHQAAGQGVEGIYPPLAGSEWVRGTPDHLIRIVLYGLKGPLTAKGKSFGAATMPAFGQVAGSGYNWNDDRIAAVLTFVRQAWNNAAGPITPAQVTAIRNKEGNRKEWSQAELEKIP